MKIWKTALRWADEQCRQNCIECSAGNRREVLGLALFNIRFPLIPKEDFTKSIVSTAVLTTEELSDAPGLIKLKFPTHRRHKNGEIIEMEIGKVSEFAQEEVESYRLSDAVEIGGFSWKILAQVITKENNEKWLGFYLYNNGHKKEEKKTERKFIFWFTAPKENSKQKDNNNNNNWACKCSSATLRIVSQNGTEDLIGTLSEQIFNEKKKSLGFPNFVSFAELLDPSKGFYNKDEDKLKLNIYVIVDEPKIEKFVSNPNKSNGTLLMEIEKLSEFAREIILSERKSEETVYIKGMPWKIWANIKTKNESTDKCLGFFLLCDASEKDGNWRRKCSATFRIVSQKNGVGGFMREFNRTSYVFNNKTLSGGWNNFISFAELMDPSKDLYNKDEDKVTLAIEFSCE
ncbi:hypothetical protein niasHS_004525 [Heterodera schachtii]|uniref:MATH domain-containing protein n=1 Tax=Heterodera schachtii TaxID=97005 RepID=A0ABD2JMV1_HETSC